jgi:signal transduction histidine kinase
MDLTVPGLNPDDLAAAFFQALVTTGLAMLFVALLFRYRKAHFAYWTLAWVMYSGRLAAILSFQLTGGYLWLYWHQVFTGWAALALLWASMVFSVQVRWRSRYLLLVAFPLVWSYLAIYRLDNFMLAAGPAVLFLSFATLATGLVFFRYAKVVDSNPARFLGGVLILWGLHDLDYPFLRAMGAWNPWGYYLDLLFELGVVAGLLLLILEDQRRGLEVFSEVSEDLQRTARSGDVLPSLVSRPLTLPGVSGSALYALEEGARQFILGAGVCEDWADQPPSESVDRAISRALRDGSPHLERGVQVREGDGEEASYAIGLPIIREQEVAGAMVVVGHARDPISALDEEFLLALGRQVGTAIETADLNAQLRQRTEELELLASRMVSLHEEERRRIARELHDETAQVFAAVKIELGALRGQVDPQLHTRMDRSLELVGTGIESIRAVTRDLRPTVLEDLGLLPALRALVTEFEAKGSHAVSLEAPDTLPNLPREADLAFFRALQEGLSNVVRHADATEVHLVIGSPDGVVRLEVMDDGVGLANVRRDGHGRVAEGMGLAGMRERISRLGGTVGLQENASGRGSRLEVSIPVKRVQGES